MSSFRLLVMEVLVFLEFGEGRVGGGFERGGGL
jgi:hypothetical protein